MCNWGPSGAMAMRRSKVDVTVEISHDGREWHKVGAARGISDQTDFQPIELRDSPIKAIRLTGDASPYHADYRQTRIISGLFTGERNFPHFAWRLFATGVDEE